MNNIEHMDKEIEFQVEHDNDNMPSLGSTGMQTPSAAIRLRNRFDDGQLAKTPQISEELFNR